MPPLRARFNRFAGARALRGAKENAAKRFPFVLEPARLADDPALPSDSRKQARRRDPYTFSARAFSRGAREYVRDGPSPGRGGRDAASTLENDRPRRGNADARATVYARASLAFRLRVLGRNSFLCP